MKVITVPYKTAKTILNGGLAAVEKTDEILRKAGFIVDIQIARALEAWELEVRLDALKRQDELDVLLKEHGISKEDLKDLPSKVKAGEACFKTILDTLNKE